MDVLGMTLRVVLPLVVVHLVVLAGIIAVVKKLLLNDTMNAVDTIKQVEADVRKKEEGIRKEIEEHEKEFEKSKVEAETELDAKRKKSEAEVAAMRDHTLADAKEQGEKILAQAKKNEETYKQQLALEMEAKTVDYAGQVFKLVFSEKTTAELNKEFISELLDALDEVEAGSITVEAENAEFISSHPIADEQKARLEKIIEQAKKNEENFKQQLALEMEAKTVDYAGQVFKLVFSEKTTAELNKEFISELLDALDEVEAGTITVEADNAEFISSHPIVDEQKVRLEKIIEDKFGVKIKVEETVQEDLLAGLIIKMGTLEVDASLLNRYQEAVGEVKKNT
jgi:F0F1-type ATP synthase membrane subunit b/b'